MRTPPVSPARLLFRRTVICLFLPIMLAAAVAQGVWGCLRLGSLWAFVLGECLQVLAFSAYWWRSEPPPSKTERMFSRTQTR